MRVALMVTCLNDAMFPDTGRAVVDLLTRLGVDVDFPEAQTCCGQPMVNTGYVEEAVPVVRTFVSSFAAYDAVVTPSGSCAGSVRHQHRLVPSARVTRRWWRGYRCWRPGSTSSASSWSTSSA